MSTVSVIIPHYGAPTPTQALLSQLSEQVDSPIIELIVVDDASPTPFPDTAGAHVIRRADNGGFGSAVNSGAAAAVGDLLLVLNSDLEIEPDFVARLVRASAPFQPAVTAPAMVSPTGEPAWSARDFPTVSHQVTEWLTPLARWRHTRAWHRGVGHHIPRGGAEVVDWLVGAALLIPADKFAHVGGFDERFFMNVEEVDLQRRLAEVGVPAVFIPEVVVVHEGGGSSATDRRRRWLAASRNAYADKWGGRRRLQAALSAATATNLAINTLRRAAGRDIAPWQTAREEWELIWHPGAVGNHQTGHIDT